MDLYSTMPSGTKLMGNTSASSVLYTMMQFNLDNFVDWGTATCSFNSQDFIDLLSFCAQFPAEYTYDENAPSEPSMIQSGQQVLYEDYISQFTDMQFTKAMFGDDICYKGYPSPSGTGTYVSVDGGLAISLHLRRQGGRVELCARSVRRGLCRQPLALRLPDQPRGL